MDRGGVTIAKRKLIEFIDLLGFELILCKGVEKVEGEKLSKVSMVGTWECLGTFLKRLTTAEEGIQYKKQTSGTAKYVHSNHNT